MSRRAILKISSAKGNCLGTGFVIDKDKGGVFIATCGHVVESCGEKSLLVDDKEAMVVKNYYDEGLDIAILYLSNIKIEPLSVVHDSTSKKVKVHGFTSFGKAIKKEKMENIKAKYNIEIENNKRKVEIVRLTSKEKITRGYSGSPVISETTGMVVGMVIVEAREQHTNYAISSKHILEVYNCPLTLVPKVENKLLVKNKKDTNAVMIDSNRLKIKGNLEGIGNMSGGTVNQTFNYSFSPHIEDTNKNNLKEDKDESFQSNLEKTIDSKYTPEYIQHFSKSIHFIMTKPLWISISTVLIIIGTILYGLYTSIPFLNKEVNEYFDSNHSSVKEVEKGKVIDEDTLKGIKNEKIILEGNIKNTNKEIYYLYLEKNSDVETTSTEDGDFKLEFEIIDDTKNVLVVCCNKNQSNCKTQTCVIGEKCDFF